jgi:hypothetical protein
MKVFFAAILFSCEIFTAVALGQTHSFPYRENFDTARVPFLPLGWSTTTARSTGGDFTTSSATPRSAPQAALASDARIAQCLLTPLISFAGKTGGSLEFYERRSSSFTAGLLLEVSVRGDSSSWIPISDTMLHSGSSSYIRRSVPLPSLVNGDSLVRFRWRTLGNGSGATGTLRVDDVEISVQRMLDLALDGTIGVAPLLTAGDDVPVTALVRNTAQSGVRTFSLSMVDSTVGACVADTAVTHFFAVGDSMLVSLVYRRIEGGAHRIAVLLSADADEDPSNNAAVVAVAVRYPPRTLVLNELMYEPVAGAPEYVELYNRSGATVDLAGWNMGDASGTAKNRATIPLPALTCRVAPSSHCVIASDSSILGMMKACSGDRSNVIVVPSLGLNNAGDDVVLFDPTGATVDSVRYFPGWHLPKTTTAGKSLERINPDLPGTDPRNWSTSVAPRGGTPGARNSIYTSALPSDASLVLSPNPFSPNNDGVEDFLGITFSLPLSGTALRVRIYDAAGRLVRTLANNEPAASAGTIVWNGRDETNTRVRMGMYIVFVEALDPRGGVLRAMKGVAVVATKLD